MGTRSIIVLACLTIASPLASAEAAKIRKKAGLGKVTTRTATASAAASGELATATATCPKGRLATGGGFAQASSSPNAYLVMRESRRASPTQWIATGEYVGPAGSLTLTTTVYCRNLKHSVSESSSAAPLPTLLSTASPAATCPGKAKAIAGGFTVNPGVVRLSFGGTNVPAVIASSRTTLKQWTVSGVNSNSGPPTARTLTAFAYCSKDVKKISELSGTSSIPPGMGTGTATSAACAKRKPLSGGGFSSPPFADPVQGIPIVTTAAGSGRAWTMTARQGGTRATTITATAYCS